MNHYYVICCSLADRLEKNDMKVWARDRENCEGSKGTAVINAKVSTYYVSTLKVPVPKFLKIDFL